MAEDFIKPEIIDQEIFLDPNKIIIYKTDKFGIFEFANDYFIEISGYEEYELMGKSMFCIQHPDMPEAIFKHLWEKLLNKKEACLIVKNLTKSGKYYWSLTNFTFKINKKDDEIIAIYGKRSVANKKSIDFFSKFYKTLISIETKKGIEAAEKYAQGYLEEKQTDLNGLVQSFYDKSEIEKTIAKSKPVQIPKIIKDQSIDNSKKVKELTKKVENLQEESLIQNSKTQKKSLFQRLFGKTEEELEEERKRKKKK